MEEELFFDGTLQQIASISEIFLQNVIVYFGFFFFFLVCTLPIQRCFDLSAIEFFDSRSVNKMNSTSPQTSVCRSLTLRLVRLSVRPCDFW